MPRDISTVVRELCLGLPQTEEFISHGSPNFRVKGGRIFATYAVNTHGDGRIALWLRSPAGAQERWVRSGNVADGSEPQADSQAFFIPPYVGPSGWLGVCLDRGLDWGQIAELIREAYAEIAPARLRQQLRAPEPVQPPELSLAPEDFDPLSAPAAQDLLRRVRDLCLALPETSEDLQYGQPNWRAGKRSFALVQHDGEVVRLNVRVGTESQHLYTADPRYRIPPYMGHQGWISLALQPEEPDWLEVRSLLRQSYRHFALQRMLKALGPD